MRARAGTHTVPTDGDAGVAANERLTAVTGAVLLMLIVLEVATLPSLQVLVSVHIVAGMVMAGPLVVKLASTGYRFARYYLGSPGYVRRGPPPLALRVLAVILVPATVVVVGSGLALTVIGPATPGALVPLHAISAILWVPTVTVHAVAHAPRLPPLVADEMRGPDRITRRWGRWVPRSVNAAALGVGAGAAVLLYPAAGLWSTWINATGNAPSPKFFIVALVLAALVLVVARPWRWRPA